MAPFIWLASYPKSGNTWARAFLTNYGADAEVEWGHWDSYHSANAAAFYEGLGVEASDLTMPEIAEGRPDLYSRVAESRTQPVLAKVHDAFALTPLGRVMFPPAVTRHAVYLVRNPLDVVVSWSYHASVSLERAVADLCDSDAKLASTHQLPQYLGDWSHHVTSWTDQDILPVHVVRFEDLVCDPVTHFSGMLRALDYGVDLPRVERAIAATTFATLQACEQKKGFAERPPGSPTFFRAGQVGQWRAALTQAQIARVCRTHRDVMTRFDYLPPDASQRDQE